MGSCRSVPNVADDEAKDPVAPLPKRKSPRRKIERNISSSRSVLREKMVTHTQVTRIQDVFDILETLGTGMGGMVQTVRNKTTGALFAMKSVLVDGMSPEFVAQMRAEVEILQQLDHPNVIKLCEVYEDERHLYLVMERCTGGELFDRLAEQPMGLFDAQHAAYLVSQMLAALLHCHRKYIAHRDIKLENFMFDRASPDACLVLIDFGLSKIFRGQSLMFRRLGSRYYIAPEVLDESVPYTMACDLWGMGVIAYMLLCGEPPFYGDSAAELDRRIASAEFAFDGEVWQQVPAAARDFVSSLLVVDAQKRLTAAQALQHPWITAAPLTLQLRRAVRTPAAAAAAAATTGATGATAPEAAATATAAAIADAPTSPQQQQQQQQDEAGPISDPVLQAMRRFSSLSRLQKATLSTVAFSMSQTHIRELRQLFRRVDKDHSGRLTLEEFRQALVSDSVTQQEADAIFNSMKQSSTRDWVSYSEFLAATLHTRAVIDDRSLRKAFRVLDTDNSGAITLSNLQEVLGHALPAEELASVIAAADVKMNGHIDYEEFLLAMGQALTGEIRRTATNSVVSDTGGAAASALASLLADGSGKCVAQPAAASDGAPAAADAAAAAIAVDSVQVDVATENDGGERRGSAAAALVAALAEAGVVVASPPPSIQAEAPAVAAAAAAAGAAAAVGETGAGAAGSADEAARAEEVGKCS